MYHSVLPYHVRCFIILKETNLYCSCLVIPCSETEAKIIFFTFLLNILYRINEHQLKCLFSLFRATKITEGDAIKRSFLIKVMCFTIKKERDFLYIQISMAFSKERFERQITVVSEH